MRALLNLWRQCIPFGCGYAPRTRPNAITATDAFAGIVGDRSIWLPCQRGCRARRGASRLETMQAALHAENVSQRTRTRLVPYFMEFDERVCLGAQRSRVLKVQRTRLQLGLFSFAIVPLLARDLASATTDTIGGVDQSGLRKDRTLTHVTSLDLGLFAAGGLAFATFTRQAFVSWVPA